ncbi:MAG: helix-turn-helix transcriptional regulator [Flavobacteriia bacterium]|nr:helix-turn-helix transcriptional regulator [Flavobacteriia bacterium]PIV96486.1 MAG: AraC family transcriptional regulator [Flavobacteriaceae bacterium CG17_big_fil_post_rev_8_21_14_2_50_31_13]PIX12589.1 MAG: AraC family transcriptional regulator [Flavobacteriaceae bacterium CG_4_8_14_3_um_filter_31_8]PIY15108.1 MAG: AraC family transcriptional regulator [Flavobacteriaceae bacterium CG_4_10_14_3_um_filter_31_253]PIZ09747.1 MAG: AraC family transcriptional regulator [Flavobacteriaceae bacteri
MKLYLKYMVSHRCKMRVREELKKLNIPYISIDLGVIDIEGELSKKKRNQLKINLKNSGLELLENKRSVLVEKIKNHIIELIQPNIKAQKENYSILISERLGYDYTYLSNVFSEEKGITIQQFIIVIRVEKVKELIMYNELSLKQIANQMQYSSAAHLSNQFKKITGSTPSYFKGNIHKERCNIETI